MTKERRVVSFLYSNDNNPVSSVIPILGLQDYTFEEIQQQWYLQDELQTLKRNTKQLARRKRQSSESSCPLSNVFSSSLSSLQKQQRDEEVVVIPVDPLVVWCCCRRARSGRGIEQWINKDHGNYSQRKKKELICAVLKRQRQLQNNSSSIITTQYTTEQQLAVVSIQHSMDAKLFARRMGIADATTTADKIIATVSSVLSKNLLRFKFLLHKTSHPCYHYNNIVVAMTITLLS